MIRELTNRLQIDLARLRSARRSPHRESGAILVESALSVLLLITMLIGVAEMGLALYSFHFVSYAAHEATRYAIVRGGDWSTTGTTCDGTGTAGSGSGSDMCVATVQDVQNFVTGMNFPGINLTASDVCVEYFSSLPSSTSSSCTTTSGTPTNNELGDVVQVTITYPYTFGLPFSKGWASYTYNLTSTSQMVIAQ